MTTNNFNVNKESAKAINVTMTVEGMGEVTCWLPKSSATITGGTLAVKPSFWKFKREEIAKEEATKGDVLVSGQYDEYDKSYGFKVTVYESMSEQSRRSRLFLPKSLCEVVEGAIKVPAWMLAKAVERCKEQFEGGSFRASMMEVEGISTARA